MLTLFNGNIPSMPVVSATAHEAATTLDKGLSRWQPPRGSADSDYLDEMDTVVGRARDARRNIGPASGVVATFQDHIVGPALRMVSMPDHRALGRDKDWAEGWSKDWEAIWRDWAESFFCDVAEKRQFSGQTRMVIDGVFTSGDILGLPMWMPDTRSGWATRMMLVEGDRLSNPDDREDSRSLRGGVEIDRYGKPLAYNIRKTHPGDDFLGYANLLGGGQWERIPAETRWGRKRVIHVLDMDRPGQTRGKPWYTPILADFKRLHQFETAALKTAIVNAMFATFIETPLDPVTLATSLGANPESQEFSNWFTTMRQIVAPMESGAMVPLMPGSRPHPFDPNKTPANFNEFVDNFNNKIATGLNIPGILFTKDFSKVNYSSARAALLEAFRHFRTRRQWLADHWATPCAGLVLEEAISKGWIEAPNFYENQRAYTRCKWIGPAKGWVDPVKEIEAAGLRIEYNISTLEDECAEQGVDWEEVAEQRAVERRKLIALGLPPDMNITRAPQVAQPETQAA